MPVVRLWSSLHREHDEAAEDLQLLDARARASDRSAASRRPTASASTPRRSLVESDLERESHGGAPAGPGANGLPHG